MKTKKILIIGASGMLGTALTNKLKKTEDHIFIATFPETIDGSILLDITNPEQVENEISNIKPDIVFNCSAYTDVDGAQSNVKAAMAVNAHGCENLAQSCKNNKALLVHISTDYVFNGNADTPYKPDDKTCPNTIYGKSKLDGEKAIIQSSCKHIIIRTSWLFGPDGNNFVKTIYNLAKMRDEIKVVNDQLGKPTYTLDLADCMIGLADKNAQGIFHYSNSPKCTWYDFAKEIVKIAKLNCNVLPCTTADFPRPAPRPAYSVLDTSKTEELVPGIVRPWQDALKDYIPQL